MVDFGKVDPQKYYTVKETAGMLGIGVSAVHMLIKRQKLVAGRRFGGRQRYITGQRLIEGFQGRPLPNVGE